MRNKLRPVTIVVYNQPVKLRTCTRSGETSFLRSLQPTAVVSWNCAARLLLAVRCRGAYSATQTP